MTKQIVMFGTAIMTTLLAMVVLWQFRIVVVYMLVSLMLAAALRPLVNRLQGKSIKVRIAWIALYLVVLSIFGFLLFLVGERVFTEIQWFTQSVSAQDRWQLPSWLAGSFIEREMTTRLPLPSKLFEAVTGSQGQLVLPAIFDFTQGIGSGLSDIVVISLLSIYWSISQVYFERLWLSLLPSGQRRQARGIWRKIEPVVGSYIRSQILYSLFAGSLLGLGYWLLGSPYPALLGLAVALACLVPRVGAAFAVIPPLIFGLLTSIQLSLSTGLLTIVVLTTLTIWVWPRFYDQKWESPILTIVLMIALADVFGIVGIILAPILSIVCQILWRRLVSHRHTYGAAALISDLRERQEHILANIQKMDEPPIPLVTSSMERLSQLLEKAEPVLQAAILADPSDELIHEISTPEQG